MEIVNKLLEKVGIDRILHFLVGCWIAAIGMVFGWSGVGFAALITLIISVFKEQMDDYFDWIDILAAMIGVGVSSLVYLICTVFFWQLYTI